MTKENNIKEMPIWLSLLPLVALVFMLIFTIKTFGSNSLNGATQVVLLSASAICCIIGIVYSKVPWRNFEESITKNIASVASALIILLLIGALGSSWMVSGIVPTMIYYGMEIIHPDVFLATTCVISAIVSVMTGSSWTTIATIGVALMGIGKAQGFAEGWVAGAIISGAYFGDKISPLSETTVLASSICGVKLFDHIRYMLITTVPSISLAIAIFIIAGLNHQAMVTEHMEMFRQAIASRFDINGWLMLVPVATGVMIAKKLPALVTLFAASVMGVVAALVFQPENIAEIANGDKFAAMMQMVYGPTQLASDNGMLAELVATRGMSGMMTTVWLILCSMTFGAALTAGGMTDGITRLFTKIARGRISTVASTVLSGVTLNGTTSDQYISILLTGSVFRGIYSKNKLEHRLLSRATEDSATVTSVLIPWNSCGMVQSTVLGVATLTYLPFCFFNILSPLMSILVATTGYKIEVKNEE